MPRVTRRRLLEAGVAGGVALAGCSADGDGEPTGRPTGTSSATATETPTATATATAPADEAVGFEAMLERTPTNPEMVDESYSSVCKSSHTVRLSGVQTVLDATIRLGAVRRRRGTPRGHRRRHHPHTAPRGVAGVGAAAIHRHHRVRTRPRPAGRPVERDGRARRLRCGRRDRGDDRGRLVAARRHGGVHVPRIRWT